jgi:hypothetical protein
MTLNHENYKFHPIPSPIPSSDKKNIINYSMVLSITMILGTFPLKRNVSQVHNFFIKCMHEILHILMYAITYVGFKFITLHPKELKIIPTKFDQLHMIMNSLMCNNVVCKNELLSNMFVLN